MQVAELKRQEQAREDARLQAAEARKLQDFIAAKEEIERKRAERIAQEERAAKVITLLAVCSRLH